MEHVWIFIEHFGFLKYYCSVSQKLMQEKKHCEDRVPLTFHNTSGNLAGQRLTATTKGFVPLIFTYEQ